MAVVDDRSATGRTEPERRRRPRRVHLERTPARPPPAEARRGRCAPPNNDQLVNLVGVRRDVHGDLGLERGSELPPCPIAHDLIDQRPANRRGRRRLLVLTDDGEHRRTVPTRAGKHGPCLVPSAGFLGKDQPVPRLTSPGRDENVAERDTLGPSFQATMRRTAEETASAPKPAGQQSRLVRSPVADCATRTPIAVGERGRSPPRCWQA